MRRAGAALVLALAATVLAAGPASAHGPAGPDLVVVFVLGGVSFEELLAVPEVKALASRGGVGLMTTRTRGDDPDAALAAALDGTTEPRGEEAELLPRVLGGAQVTWCLVGALRPPTDRPCPGGRDVRAFDHAVLFDLRGAMPSDPASRRRHLAEVGGMALRWLRLLPGHTLLLVLVPRPSAAMDRVGDELTPLVVAGAMDHLGPVSPGTPPGSLRSPTTRLDGLVANVDVGPTVLRALGVPVPPAMEGSPVQVVPGPPPLALHRTHLEQRRIRVPVQVGVLAFVVGGALAGLALLVRLWRRGRVGPGAARALRSLALAEVALAVPLALGGLLPRLTYGWVVPFLVATTAALAAVAGAVRRGPTGPLVALGAVTVAVLLVDLAAFGGRALRVPLVGGTAFDGARFHGLPNVFIAPLLAGGLLVATALPARPGLALLCVLGLVAGLPGAGANLGAAVTLFSGAGLWWRARARDGRPARPSLLRDALLALALVAAGTGAVLAANRWLPGPPTHLGRFVAAAERGPGALLERLGDRLEVSLGMVREVPLSAVPLVGLAVVLAAALRPAGPLARGLAVAGPRWRDAVAVLCGASVVAFLANDTGVAAAAPGFLYAAAALLYPAFLEEAMVRRAERARPAAVAKGVSEG